MAATAAAAPAAAAVARADPKYSPPPTLRRWTIGTASVVAQPER